MMRLNQQVRMAKAKGISKRNGVAPQSALLHLHGDDVGIQVLLVTHRRRKVP